MQRAILIRKSTLVPQTYPTRKGCIRFSPPLDSSGRCRPRSVILQRYPREKLLWPLQVFPPQIQEHHLKWQRRSLQWKSQWTTIPSLPNLCRVVYRLYTWSVFLQNFKYFHHAVHDLQQQLAVCRLQANVQWMTISHLVPMKPVGIVVL